MASLGKRIRRRIRRDERGAIAIVVAVLLGAGVLTGMAAMVVDVAQLYQERAELQNGADAAAIGVAKSCALGLCDPSVARQYASGNASQLTGGTEGIGLVCGSGPLPGCPPSTGQIFDCPPPPPAGTNYVDVHTHTQTASGSTLLPPVFAATILGNTGYQGTTVDACAQAEWGAPTAAATVAVTIPACEWDQATQRGASFAPYQPGQLPAPSFDQVLTLNPQPGTGGAGCATEPAGADGPLTFGLATDQSGNCTLQVSAPTYTGQASTSVSQSCLDAVDNSEDSLTPILVPIYVSVTNAGGNLTYTLQGFADFVVTGYHTPESTDSDRLNPANDCTGVDQYCINGYFVQDVIPATGPLTGTNLGVSVIDLTG
jgi:Putative Flp pilus-assembly TadE/G-like